MNKSRLLQALWLLLLSLVCVLLFYYRRESTKSPQEMLAKETTILVQATPPVTPIPLPTETPAPTPYEVLEVFVPQAVTPAPIAAASAFLLISPTPEPTPTPSATPVPIAPFSLIWFSDTQYYAYKKPEIFLSMADWAIEVKTAYNVLAVVCTGDIVDNRNYQRHWDNADAAISRIREELPFYCVAGNHDVGADSVDYTAYRQADFCTVPETMQLNEDGRCWVLPLDEQQIVLCGIGWQNDTAYADWVKSRLSEYPDYSAILLVHSFLADDGTLSTNGKRVEKAILKTCPTIRLVLCGHNDGSVRWQQQYPDGHYVNAIMYNFQDDKKYGLGYARILMFNPLTRNIAVTTYSPYLNDYNYYKDTARDTFTLYDAW